MKHLFSEKRSRGGQNANRAGETRRENQFHDVTFGQNGGGIYGGGPPASTGFGQDTGSGL